MTIPWPANYLALFRVMSLVSSAGEEFIDIQCALETPVPIAHIEYATTLMYALMPPLLVILSVLFWKYIGSRYVPPNRVRPMMTGTIVLLLYLIFPSVSGKVIGLWKCENIENVGSVFVVDPETLCTDDTHRMWIGLVGVPSVLLYVMGLPLGALLTLYKFRNKLDEINTRIRFGLLYDGFNRENYMHEFWVALRKVLVIIIGIFSEDLQVLLALGVVGILLTHTVMARPFLTDALSRLEILLLTCCFLTLWVGGIFVVYPACQTESSGARTICVTAEGVVIAFNIFCTLAGLGAYLWFSCSNRCIKLKRILKVAFSSLRCCKKCCKSSAGIWFTANEADWKDNPMKKEQEMPELSSVDGDNSECIGRLRAENQKLRAENKQQQAENQKLREENAQLRGEDNELGVPKDVWEQVTGADGSIYFHNRDTNETAWEMPEEQATWEEVQDEEGRAYYYNRTSGETSWEPPMISNPM